MNTLNNIESNKSNRRDSIKHKISTSYLTVIINNNNIKTITRIIARQNILIETLDPIEKRRNLVILSKAASNKRRGEEISSLNL